MGDSEEVSNNKTTEGCDIKNELSSLVEKKQIPSNIANRLEKKLLDKNIKISKEQLLIIVKKINNIVQTYSKNEVSLPQKQTSYNNQSDQNMHKLIETIEKLERRITNIESNKIENIELPDEEFEKKASQKIITTDDIQLPEKSLKTVCSWKVDTLKDVPTDPESIIVLMKWLQYLIDKCGKDNLANILDYYVDIGWISQNAKISLIDYSNGITEESVKKEELSHKNITDLPSKDHIQSFIFIQKLKGLEFDRHFIDRIDSEINRITKKLDYYQFK